MTKPKAKPAPTAPEKPTPDPAPVTWRGLAISRHGSRIQLAEVVVENGQTLVTPIGIPQIPMLASLAWRTEAVRRLKEIF